MKLTGPGSPLPNGPGHFTCRAVDRRRCVSQGRPMSAPNPIVSIGHVRFGNALPLTLIAGPCQLESRTHALEMAFALKEIAARAGIGLVYKTSFDKRTEPVGRAPAHRARCGTADLCPRSGRRPAARADRRARVGRNARVSRESSTCCRSRRSSAPERYAGCRRRNRRAVNVKKGQFLAPWDMATWSPKYPARHANGWSPSAARHFGYNTLVSDMRALADLARTGAPVIFRPTFGAADGGQGASRAARRVRAGAVASGGRGRRRRRVHRDASGPRQGAV